MKKFFKRLVASALSLVVCASMVTPAFAASFTDVTDAIAGKGGELVEGTEDTYGYAKRVDEETQETSYGITARTVKNEDGSETRAVELHEDVKYDASKDRSNSTIVVDKGKDVSIELNGHEIRLNAENQATEGSVVKVDGEGTKLTVTDSTAVADADGNYIFSGDGKIAGGYGSSTKGHGGGVTVTNKASFEMTGGNITDNLTKQSGGGIYVKDGTVELTGVTVDNNQTAASWQSGGGIAILGNSTVTLTDTTIAHNRAGGNQANQRPNFGGGLYMGSGESNVTLSGTAIYDNKVKDWTEDITMNGSFTGKLTVEDKDTYRDAPAPEGSDSKYEVKQEGWVNASTNMPGNPNDGNVADQGWGPYNTTVTYNSTWSDEAQEKRHVYGDPTQENVKNGTCAEEGSYEEVHRCLEPGCNHESRETKTIDKLAHTPAEETVRENEIPAKIGVAGSYDEVIMCSVCGEEISRETKTIDALPVPADPDDPVGPGDIEIEDADVPLAGLPFELAPEEKLTRAQLVAILHWLDGSPDDELPDFTDVSADHLWALALGWAQANGIIEAYEDGTFEPDNAATRGLLIAILNGYAKYIGSDITIELTGDADEILTWAQAEEIINDFFALLNA